MGTRVWLHHNPILGKLIIYGYGKTRNPNKEHRHTKREGDLTRIRPNSDLYSPPQLKDSNTTLFSLRTLKNVETLKLEKPTLAWDELLGILRVHEVHLQKKDYLSKRNSNALKTGETISRWEESKSSSKALKVKMAESNGLDNSSKGSMNNEVALTFRNFKQIMNKKGKFQYSFR
ncbi:hypothetical protein JHK85_051511 [Glycine max]|nr:hypothetical protein JHK86_050671 [Glycine max]KAG4936592.1 hypothetical protein JHK85_051511 [Glycine max]